MFWEVHSGKGSVTSSSCRATLSRHRKALSQTTDVSSFQKWTVCKTQLCKGLYVSWGLDVFVRAVDH